MKKTLFQFVLIIIVGSISVSSCKKKDDSNNDDKSPTTLVLGQDYQGGKIAYILKSGDPGYDANVQHGLITAPNDLSTSAEWGCSGTTFYGTSVDIGTGQANTTKIVNNCSTAGTAARLCNDLVLGGYSDWYLPSMKELNMIWLNQASIGGFLTVYPDTYYWSSSEYNYTQAYYFSFLSGGGGVYNDVKSRTCHIRAVRSF